jgi:hypothetical protein
MTGAAMEPGQEGAEFARSGGLGTFGGMIVVMRYHQRMKKERLSASVDSDLLLAAESAVRHGRADTLSAWINEAMRRRIEDDRRLDALAAFVAAYEAEHGEITAEDIRDATRQAQARARTVRSPAPRRVPGQRR